MAKIGGFVTFFYFLAWAAGIIALMLPFWVHTDSKEISVLVTVKKTTHRGLWWEHETFEVQQNGTNYNDRPWASIVHKDPDTHGLKAIKAMIIIGLTILFVAMFIAGCTRCCSDDSNQVRMHMVFFGAGIAALVAGAVIAIAPIVFYTDVRNDYIFERGDLGWCFWLIVASACASFTAGVLGILGCLVSFRRQKSAIVKE